MAYGVKALRQLLMGVETSAGTAVPATSMWRGTGTIQDDRVIKFPVEDVGILPGTDRSYIPALGASLLLEATPLTLEQFPYICEMGIKTASATQDGAGSDYIREYTFPTTSQNTIKTYTFEGGDNNEAEEVEYCFVTDFTLTGDEREAWTMAANVMGRQATVTTFTATAAVVPAVDEMLFGKTRLYIDAATGAFGGTIKSSTLLAAQFTYKTGIKAVWTASGNLYFDFHKMIMPEARLKLTFEHETIAAAQKALARAQTTQLFRLDLTGETLTSAGTTYSTKRMLLDVAGKYEKFTKIGERNGNDIIEMEVLGRYSPDAALFGGITIVNELSALP